MTNVIPLRAFGATQSEWDHFALNLELIDDLLPVVSNPSAVISPRSTLKELGKTPSQYYDGLVGGIPEWTKYHASNSDILKWSTKSDYGICIQTRNIRAIDVDVEDAELARRIYARLSERYNFPKRYRDNSSKFLLAFRLEGQFQKRKFECASGIVEFLANGQQFIAIGYHKSKTHYQWLDGLPGEFPSLTEAQFDRLWSDLQKEFGTSESHTSKASTKALTLSEVYKNDAIAQYLIDHDYVKGQGPTGALTITCPWEDEHSSDSSETATVYWPAHTGGYEHGGFDCKHAHCEHRTYKDLEQFFGLGASSLEQFDVLEPIPTTERSRFDPIPAHEFAVLRQTNWIIKGVMPDAELMMIYGASASGKTFMTLDLAGAIARGAEWRGHKVKQGHVVYIAAEGANGVRKRLLAYAQHHQVDLHSLDISVIQVAPNFLDPKEALEVAQAIVNMSKDVRLIIIDTAAQVMPGGDENGSQDMSRVITHSKGLHRATKAPVLLVHHSGKDAAKGARGWSGMRAAMDAEFEVVRSDNDRVLTVTKQKDGDDGEEFGFTLSEIELGRDEDNEAITSCVVTHGQAVAKAQRKIEPKGAIEKSIVRIIQGHDLVGDGLNQSTLIDLVVEQLPDAEEGKRDRRRYVTLRAIEALIGSGHLRKEGNNYVYL